jgi:hypothetical protein
MIFRLNTKFCISEKGEFKSELFWSWEWLFQEIAFSFSTTKSLIIVLTSFQKMVIY